MPESEMVTVIEEEIKESFEELLRVDEVVEVTMRGETEGLCASCLSPVDVDEEQDVAYCEICQTKVFVERREL